MGRMLAPIKSIKHYVGQSNAALVSGTIRNQVLVDAVTVATAGASAGAVEEGSLVKAIYLDFWVLGDDLTGTNSQINSIFEKVPAGQVPVTAAQIVNLGSYPNKKNVFDSFQGNIGMAIDGNPATPQLRGWHKIPKGKQRMGLGDKLVYSILSSGNDVAICGQAVYKEYA